MNVGCFYGGDCFIIVWHIGDNRNDFVLLRELNGTNGTINTLIIRTIIYLAEDSYNNNLSSKMIKSFFILF